MDKVPKMGIKKSIKVINMKKKLVICSGGLDSTSMALISLNEPDSEVSLLSFNYGQKAMSELDRVAEFAKKFNIEHIIMDISPLKSIFGKTQLTSDDEVIENNYQQNVVVPLRNAVFLQIAFVYAYTNGFDEVILGSHLDDCEERNGERLFPDCSPEFFKSFELAMDLGTFRKDKKVRITTPSILGMSKVDLIRQGVEISPETIFNSWSCYRSGDKQCGHCDSCKNRKNAFLSAGIEDLTKYEE